MEGWAERHSSQFRRRGHRQRGRAGSRRPRAGELQERPEVAGAGVREAAPGLEDLDAKAQSPIPCPSPVQGKGISSLPSPLGRGAGVRDGRKGGGGGGGGAGPPPPRAPPPPPPTPP